MVSGKTLALSVHERRPASSAATRRFQTRHSQATESADSSNQQDTQRGMNSKVTEACGSATPLKEDLIEDKGNLASVGVGKRINATRRVYMIAGWSTTEESMQQALAAAPNTPLL